MTVVAGQTDLKLSEVQNCKLLLKERMSDRTGQIKHCKVLAELQKERTR
jgi:hypothetical protein